MTGSTGTGRLVDRDAQRKMSNGLLVNRGELAQGLAILAKCLRTWRRKRGTLSYEDGMLTIRLGHVTVGAVAEGEWRGEALVAAEDLRWLATVLPRTDPVLLVSAPQCIYVGKHALSCRWRARPGK